MNKLGAFGTKDWDKLAVEINKQEEEDEKVNPGVDNLFQKIYEDGSDEVKKAMIKSFVCKKKFFNLLF